MKSLSRFSFCQLILIVGVFNGGAYFQGFYNAFRLCLNTYRFKVSVFQKFSVFSENLEKLIVKFSSFTNQNNFWNVALEKLFMMTGFLPSFTTSFSFR